MPDDSAPILLQVYVSDGSQLRSQVIGPIGIPIARLWPSTVSSRHSNPPRCFPMTGPFVRVAAHGGVSGAERPSGRPELARVRRKAPNSPSSLAVRRPRPVATFAGVRLTLHSAAGPSRIAFAPTHVPKVGDQIREFRIWNRGLGETTHDHARPSPHARRISNERGQRFRVEVLGRIRGKIQVGPNRPRPIAVHLMARKAISLKRLESALNTPWRVVARVNV